MMWDYVVKKRCEDFMRWIKFEDFGNIEIKG